MNLKIYNYTDKKYEKLPSDYLTKNNLWMSVVLDKKNRLLLVKDHKQYIKDKYDLEYDATLISVHPDLKSEIFINWVGQNEKRIYYAGYNIRKDQYALLEWISINFEFILYRVNIWYWHITRIAVPSEDLKTFITDLHHKQDNKMPVLKLMYSPPKVDVL